MYYEKIEFNRSQYINIFIFILPILISFLSIYLQLDILNILKIMNSIFLSLSLIFIISIIKSHLMKQFSMKTYFYLFLVLSFKVIMNIGVNPSLSGINSYNIFSLLITTSFLLIWMHHPYKMTVIRKNSNQFNILIIKDQRLFLPNIIEEINIANVSIIFQPSIIEENFGLRLNLLKIFYRSDYWFHNLIIKDNDMKMKIIKISPIQENSQYIINKLYEIFEGINFTILQYPKISFPLIIPKINLINNVPIQKINSGLIDIRNYHSYIGKYVSIPPREFSLHAFFLIVNIILLFANSIITNFFIAMLLNNYSTELDWKVISIIILSALELILIKQLYATIITFNGNHSLIITSYTFKLTYSLSFLPKITIELPMKFNPYLREISDKIYLIVVGDKHRIDFKIPLFTKK